jgi:hypothetical protein
MAIRGAYTSSTGTSATWSGSTGIGGSHTTIRGIFLVEEGPFSWSVGLTGYLTSPQPAMSYRKYERNLPKFLRKKRGH